MLSTFVLGLLCSSLAAAAPAPQVAGLPTSAAPAVPTASTPTAPATPATATPGPIVNLSYGSFQGSNASGIVNFLGVPFAQPPLGDLRFAWPLPPLNLGKAVIQATARGAECPQQAVTAGTANGIPASLVDTIQAIPALQSTQSGVEDCLFINVQAPAVIPKGTLLPVLVWIYGGGFEIGSASYDATPLIKRSVVQGTPVIVVSMAYRLMSLGFMASKEIQDAGAGNAGMMDQRLALRWVQQNIHLFGGDRSLVTVWGESAGSISVALQMVAFDGDLTMPHAPGSAPGFNTPLFRGGFMESGAQVPVGSILGGQEFYDQIAAATNCTNTDGAASLACLRAAPYNEILAATDQTPGFLSYTSLRNAWVPRTDGIFLTKDGQVLVDEGKIPAIPFIIGDCDDEGTLFAVASANITTNAEARAYLQSHFARGSTEEEMDQLLLQYPQDPTQGSPFNTGYANQLSPQFKRLSSFIGDFVFQAPRRYFLNKVFSIGKVRTWSYLYVRNKATPFLGSFHSSDLTLEFQAAQIGGIDNEALDYLISFTNTLDPNSPNNSGIFWPEWSPKVPNLLTFLDRPLGGVLGLAITLDTYRLAAMEYITELGMKYPL
ncbi:hypothetical protein RQP46_003718 [Phenoliferia psychrophenolica]